MFFDSESVFSKKTLFQKTKEYFFSVCGCKILKLGGDLSNFDFISSYSLCAIKKLIKNEAQQLLFIEFFNGKRLKYRVNGLSNFLNDLQDLASKNLGFELEIESFEGEEVEKKLSENHFFVPELQADTNFSVLFSIPVKKFKYVSMKDNRGALAEFKQAPEDKTRFLSMVSLYSASLQQQILEKKEKEKELAQVGKDSKTSAPKAVAEPEETKDTSKTMFLVETRSDMYASTTYHLSWEDMINDSSCQFLAYYDVSNMNSFNFHPKDESFFGIELMTHNEEGKCMFSGNHANLMYKMASRDLDSEKKFSRDLCLFQLMDSISKVNPKCEFDLETTGTGVIEGVRGNISSAEYLDSFLFKQISSFDTLFAKKGDTKDQKESNPFEDVALVQSERIVLREFCQSFNHETLNTVLNIQKTAGKTITWASIAKGILKRMNGLGWFDPSHRTSADREEYKKKLKEVISDQRSFFSLQVFLQTISICSIMKPFLDAFIVKNNPYTKPDGAEPFDFQGLLFDLLILTDTENKAKFGFLRQLVSGLIYSLTQGYCSAVSANNEINAVLEADIKKNQKALFFRGDLKKEKTTLTQDEDTIKFFATEITNEVASNIRFFLGLDKETEKMDSFALYSMLKTMECLFTTLLLEEDLFLELTTALFEIRNSLYILAKQSISISIQTIANELLMHIYTRISYYDSLVPADQKRDCMMQKEVLQNCLILAHLHRALFPGGKIVQTQQTESPESAQSFRFIELFGSYSQEFITFLKLAIIPWYMWENTNFQSESGESLSFKQAVETNWLFLDKSDATKDKSNYLSFKSAVKTASKAPKKKATYALLVDPNNKKQAAKKTKEKVAAAELELTVQPFTVVLKRLKYETIQNACIIFTDIQREELRKSLVAEINITTGRLDANQDEFSEYSCFNYEEFRIIYPSYNKEIRTSRGFFVRMMDISLYKGQELPNIPDPTQLMHELYYLLVHFAQFHLKEWGTAEQLHVKAILARAITFVYTMYCLPLNQPFPFLEHFMKKITVEHDSFFLIPDSDKPENKPKKVQLVHETIVLLETIMDGKMNAKEFHRMDCVAFVMKHLLTALETPAPNFKKAPVEIEITKNCLSLLLKISDERASGLDPGAMPVPADKITALRPIPKPIMQMTVLESQKQFTSLLLLKKFYILKHGIDGTNAENNPELEGTLQIIHNETQFIKNQIIALLYLLLTMNDVIVPMVYHTGLFYFLLYSLWNEKSKDFSLDLDEYSISNGDNSKKIKLANIKDDPNHLFVRLLVLTHDKQTFEPPLYKMDLTILDKKKKIEDDIVTVLKYVPKKATSVSFLHILLPICIVDQLSGLSSNCPKKDLERFINIFESQFEPLSEIKPKLQSISDIATFDPHFIWTNNMRSKVYNNLSNSIVDPYLNAIIQEPATIPNYTFPYINQLTFAEEAEDTYIGTLFICKLKFLLDMALNNQKLAESSIFKDGNMFHVFLVLMFGLKHFEASMNETQILPLIQSQVMIMGPGLRALIDYSEKIMEWPLEYYASIEIIMNRLIASAVSKLHKKQSVNLEFLETSLRLLLSLVCENFVAVPEKRSILNEQEDLKKSKIMRNSMAPSGKKPATGTSLSGPGAKSQENNADQQKIENFIKANKIRAVKSFDTLIMLFRVVYSSLTTLIPWPSNVNVPNRPLSSGEVILNYIFTALFSLADQKSSSWNKISASEKIEYIFQFCISHSAMEQVFNPCLALLIKLCKDNDEFVRRLWNIGIFMFLVKNVFDYNPRDSRHKLSVKLLQKMVKCNFQSKNNELNSKASVMPKGNAQIFTPLSTYENNQWGFHDGIYTLNDLSKFIPKVSNFIFFCIFF